MTKLRIMLPVLLAVALAASTAFSEQLPSLEKAAAALQASTVTVRVAPIQTQGEAADDNPSDVDAPPQDAAAPRQVTVCSGVSLGDGLIVTYIRPAAGARIRITIPNGDQAGAEVRVIDHVSGLTLLESDRRNIPGLTLAEKPPVVGEWVLSAAAWGAERPVVSFGILSGTNRTIPGVNFPPLLQCDLRSAETSSGAALVDRLGALLGVIVATEATSRRSGWTYAVPIRHAERLLRARVPGKVIVLNRRRPVVGLQLSAGDSPGSVVVSRVEKGGPAEKAGIREGDRVLAAEGLTIRSVYQVVRPLLQKQPGDKMTLLVSHNGQSRQVEVTLGGGTELVQMFSSRLRTEIRGLGIIFRSAALR